MALEIVVHLFERTSRWLRVGMRARDDGQALSHEIFGDVGGVFLGRHRDGRGNCDCNCVVDAVVARDAQARAGRLHRLADELQASRERVQQIESTHFGLLHGNV